MAKQTDRYTGHSNRENWSQRAISEVHGYSTTLDSLCYISQKKRAMLQSHSQSSSGKLEIGSLSTLCFFRLSFGSAIIQEGTSQPEDTNTLAIFLKNGLSSSVKNVIASPDLPALPHRPVQRKYRYIYKAFQYHKVPTPDAHMQTNVTAN